MDSLPRDATLEEGLLSAGQVYLSAPSSYLRDGLLGNTVFYRDTTSLFLEVDGRAGKVQEDDFANPCVTNMVHQDTIPAVVLILGIPCGMLGVNRQVLHTAFCDFSMMVGLDDRCPTVCLGEGGGDRSVEGYRRSIDGSDGTVPGDVDIRSLPTRIVESTTKVIHVQRRNPLCGTGT